MTARARALLRAFLGIALLAWLIHYVDTRALLDALRTARPGWIAIGFFAFLASVLFPCLRLLVLFRASGMTPATAIRITWASYFFNQLLPTGLGGDAYRTVRLRFFAQGWTAAIGPILFERLIGALSLLMPALLYLGFRRPMDARLATAMHRISFSRHAFLAAIAMATLIAVAAVLLRSRLLGAAKQIWSELRRVEISAATTAAVVALSLAFHAMRILGMNAFLLAVGQSIPFGEILIATALMMFASLVPLSIGALGVREGVLVYALGLYGVPAPAAMTVALLNRLVSIVIGASGAFVSWDRPSAHDLPAKP